MVEVVVVDDGVEFVLGEALVDGWWVRLRQSMLMSHAGRWRWRPVHEGANWGRWGPGTEETSGSQTQNCCWASAWV